MAAGGRAWRSAESAAGADVAELVLAAADRAGPATDDVALMVVRLDAFARRSAG